MRYPPSMFLIVALLSACGGKQPGQPMPTASPTVAPAAAYSALRGTLRQLATLQGRHYEVHGKYATELATLAPLALPRGVAVVIPAAHANGWMAEATHAALPGRSCVYWYGREGALAPISTKMERRSGDAAPGTALCDGDATR